MPADYQSTARALSVSPSRHSSPSSSSSPEPSRSNSPRRSSQQQQQQHAADRHAPIRRLSEPSQRHFRQSSAASHHSGNGSAGGAAASYTRRAWRQWTKLGEQTIRAYMRLSPLQRALAVAAAVLGWVFLILALTYSHRFFAWLAPITESWKGKPWGWLIVFMMVVVTAFPPMIGYSTACTITGFVYGFPLGWPIAAAGSTVGSLAAFIASRTVLSKYVDRMVGHDHRFRALGQVLRREGLLYLTAIRFCPLPFSLSNGFLSTVPSITPWAFAVSTFFSSPKLLVHIFIGSRLAIVAGEDMSAGAKALNYLSMVFFGAIGITVGLVVYRRTMARAAEIAREEGLDAETQAAAEEGAAGLAYNDEEDDEAAEGDTLMDPDDAAALMSEDDMSLWETQVNEEYSDADGEPEAGKQTGKK